MNHIPSKRHVDRPLRGYATYRLIPSLNASCGEVTRSLNTVIGVVCIDVACFCSLLCEEPILKSEISNKSALKGTGELMRTVLIWF